MIIKLRLLPFKAKVGSVVLIIASFFAAYFYFLGGKPEIFNMKVYALMSVYLEKQSFAVIQTNILDELAAILFIIGIVLFTFSKERIEKTDYPTLRGKAFIHSLFITLAIWILLFMLIYGMVIFVFSAGIFMLFFIIYNLLFRLYILKSKYR